jgi:capsular polysaccharide biosynthesis protein
VAEPVVEELNLQTSPEAVAGATSVEVIPDTQIIIVTYTDTKPQRAQRVVNAIGNEFSEQVPRMNPNTNVTPIVVEEATLPQAPVSPDLKRIGLIGLLGGLMLAVALAFALEYRDDSWESPEEVERVSGVPIFGVIPTFKAHKQKSRTISESFLSPKLMSRTERNADG